MLLLNKIISKLVFAAFFVSVSTGAFATDVDGKKNDEELVFSSLEATNDSELEGTRGTYQGIDQSVLSTTLEGSVTGNSSTNTTSGDNMVADTFEGTSGIFTVLQNSGNNVSMQNATVVNVIINNQAIPSVGSQ